MSSFITLFFELDEKIDLLKIIMTYEFTRHLRNRYQLKQEVMMLLNCSVNWICFVDRNNLNIPIGKKRLGKVFLSSSSESMDLSVSVGFDSKS